MIKSVYDDISKEVQENSKALELYRNKFILEDVLKPLGRYEKVVQRVAEDQAKQVNIVLNKSQIFVDNNKYKSLVAACIHVFRNAVDHGIEDSATREMIGKPGQAKIEISGKNINDKEVEITVQDDGQGVDARFK